MRQMTTIYLDDEHIKYFKNNKTLNKSELIRQLLDKFILKNDSKHKIK